MDPPATAKVATAVDGPSPGTPDASLDNKRRSSSRSIKRKRFDDEIVEYSLGLPPAQVSRLGNRARTQSQTLVSPVTAATPPIITGIGAIVADPAATELTVSTSTPAALGATTASGSSGHTVAAVSAPTTSTSLATSVVPPTATSTLSASSVTDAATAAADTLVPHTSNATVAASAGPSASAVAVAAHPMKSQTPVTSGSSALPEKRRAAKNVTAALAAVGSNVGLPTAAAYPTGSGVVGAANTAMPAAATGHSAAAAGPTASKRAKKSARVGQQPVSTKDLGRWKPIDDLALILGVQQTNDLRMVHRGIKFSCKFTVQELQSRWYSLMYEETISRLAVAAMRNLHPELVESVQAKALYTTQEEELLGGIKSNESPTLDTFQDLLERNALVFYSARTAKSLHTHWQLMKQYALLPDQQSQLVAAASAFSASFGAISGISGRHNEPSTGNVPAKLQTFDEAEAELNDAELLAEQRDDTIELELTLADRCNKKEIRMLENELTRWTVLVDSLTGVGFIPEFDNQTLAVLRGRLVRYLMRSREISFGRTTKDQAVDVDLSLEGPAHKASRRQGTIKLRSNGDFFIVNEGKRPLYIDGAPLLQGTKGRLGNNAVIEMAGLRFIFLINNDLINAIRQESAKMSGPLS